MQDDYPPVFERDTAGTEAEWLQRLPGACGEHPLSLGDHAARVAIGAGGLSLDWTVLEPRRIALLHLARLGVRFRFEGVDDATRLRFMRHFDLYMQRGGG